MCTSEKVFCEIRPVTFLETLPVRQLVLRPGKPLKDCIFEGDELPSSLHFGAFVEEQFAGVITLMANKNPHFQDDRQFQLRGMAVLPEFKGKKCGKTLLERAEKQLRRQQIELLWCNAREIAIGFYEKHGFTIWGEPFEIPTIGTHYIMHKSLIDKS